MQKSTKKYRKITLNYTNFLQKITLIDMKNQKLQSKTAKLLPFCPNPNP